MRWRWSRASKWDEGKRGSLVPLAHHIHRYTHIQNCHIAISTSTQRQGAVIVPVRPRYSPLETAVLWFGITTWKLSPSIPSFLPFSLFTLLLRPLLYGANPPLPFIHRQKYQNSQPKKQTLCRRLWTSITHITSASCRLPQFGSHRHHHHHRHRSWYVPVIYIATTPHSHHPVGQPFLTTAKTAIARSILDTTVYHSKPQPTEGTTHLGHCQPLESAITSYYRLSTSYCQPFVPGYTVRPFCYSVPFRLFLYLLYRCASPLRLQVPGPIFPFLDWLVS